MLKNIFLKQLTTTHFVAGFPIQSEEAVVYKMATWSICQSQ